MKLSDCKNGEKVKIINVSAGIGAVKNLTRLGLNIGNVIEIIRSSFLNGPIVISYRDTEIAIGHGLAEKIRIEK